MTAPAARAQPLPRERPAALAPYAQHAENSRGRLHPEPEHDYRGVFARDRDRILHSRAFRRLQYKTQVFVHHEGDHYRNRLTHTLEASQIARTLARALALNEELAEAVVLAHDLGHTPFGHTGEEVLKTLLRADGGFDHNRQTLRIVDWLELRYPGFRGLNLSFETRAALLKHGAHWPHPVALPALGAQPSLEAQVADLADEIAYLCHDLDDGLRAGLLQYEQLEECALFASARAATHARHGTALSRPVLRAQCIIALTNRLVTDLIDASRAMLLELAPASAVAACALPKKPIRYSKEISYLRYELKTFLYKNLYEHPQVCAVKPRVAGVLAELYEAFRADPGLLPEPVTARFEPEGEARPVADYIAGMTDRFAQAEHARLCGAAG